MSFGGKQNDDDFQRHNADRHYRQGSGQDRFRQQAVRKDPREVLYTVQGQKTGPGGIYYLLLCVGSSGPRNGQWVNEQELIPVGGLFRVR